MSNEDNYDMKYNESSNSNESENPENDIRKICLWTPTDVYNYFSPRVPQQVAEEIKQHVRTVIKNCVVIHIFLL